MEPGRMVGNESDRVCRVLQGVQKKGVRGLYVLLSVAWEFSVCLGSQWFPPQAAL